MKKLTISLMVVFIAFGFQLTSFSQTTIILKDGRYKYSFSDFLYTYSRLRVKDYPLEYAKSPSFGLMKKNWVFIQAQVKEEIKGLIESLERYACKKKILRSGKSMK